jgi:putative solute:sodium symporter small subunit
LTENDRQAYWRTNLRLMALLLTIWALVSLVASTLLVDWLNNVSIGSVPFGFWMGQQGSIVTFVVLIAVYVWRMEKLDESYGIDEEAAIEAGKGQA